MLNMKRLLKSHRFKRFYDSLEKLTDVRMKGKIKHRLSDCLTIIILASLSGCNIFKEYIWFAKKYENRLKKFLALSNGIPSHDTLERIMHKIKNEELEPALVRIIIRHLNLPKIVSLDGKFIRGTRDATKEKTSAINIVTLYDVINKAPLMSCQTGRDKNKKGGEQGAIEHLLRKYHRLHPKDNLIISIDAIGANQHIINLCNELGYGFVINIKNDEKEGLGGIIKDDFLTELSNDKSDRISKTIIQNKKVDHGRLEKRTFYLISDLSYARDRYKGLSSVVKSIGMMVSETLTIRKDEVTTCQRFFIMSEMDVAMFSHTKRKHWNIEAFHYILDNSFMEDRCTLRKGSGALNLNLIRKFVFTIIQINKTSKSFSESRRENVYLSPHQLLYKILYPKTRQSDQ